MDTTTNDHLPLATRSHGRKRGKLINRSRFSANSARFWLQNCSGNVLPVLKSQRPKAADVRLLCNRWRNEVCKLLSLASTALDVCQAIAVHNLNTQGGYTSRNWLGIPDCPNISALGRLAGAIPRLVARFATSTTRTIMFLLLRLPTLSR